MPRNLPQLNEHPQRLCQRAQIIAIEQKDNPAIQELAQIVAALAYHIERVKAEARRPRVWGPG